ncbi:MULTISPECIES: MFS transporter [unclassified Leptolyngbya]|uniref:MFS transporter n=1 Tax=unclassified Leptolyngbya TaxID=2650499 RepID=UPI001F550C2E|nr:MULTISPECIES: MFS transporter [unclassified Leptolyngbya]
MTQTHSSAPAILWSPVWALAAMQGAITLMWVTYNLYLPKFLEQFGFPVAAATALIIAENILSAGVEPLMGSFSDRTQRWLGTRFPFIATGVIVASVLFMAIPAIALFGAQVGTVMRSILIIALIAWALSMTIFRSPALSLLGRYAINSQMPLAASILTLVGAVTGAIGPVANQALLKLGAPLTFTIGSLVLLGAATLLRSVAPPAPNSDTVAETHEPLDWSRLGLIFGAGMGIAIGFRLMLTMVPLRLAESAGSGAPSWILLVLFVAIALSALPTGTLAVRLGNSRAMLIGLGALAIALSLCLINLSSAGVAALTAILGVAFSLVSNGTLPFALSLVPPVRAGLATGLFFGGGALGVSLFFSLFQKLNTSQGLVGGAIAFLFAAGCIALCQKRVNSLMY